MPAAAVMHFENADAAADAVPELTRPGDLVLVKASRGIRLEKVAQAIEFFRQAVSARAAV
jgi:UDP-N-acetylmuramyl pentapeptide synthase